MLPVTSSASITSQHSTQASAPVPTPLKAKSAAPITQKRPVKEGNGADFWTVKGGAMHGRAKLWDEEAEAITLGGASQLF